RQLPAFQRQPPLLESQPTHAGDALGGGDRFVARSGVTRARRAKAPHLLLAHPANPPRSIAHHPDGATNPIRRLQATATQLSTDGVGTVPSRIDSNRGMTKGVGA